MDTSETEQEERLQSAYTEMMASLQHGIQNAEVDENGNKFLHYTGEEQLTETEVLPDSRRV